LWSGKYSPHVSHSFDAACPILPRSGGRNVAEVPRQELLRETVAASCPNLHGRPRGMSVATLRPWLLKPMHMLRSAACWRMRSFMLLSIIPLKAGKRRGPFMSELKCDPISPGEKSCRCARRPVAVQKRASRRSVTVSRKPSSGKSAMLLALRDMEETSLLGIPILVLGG
jgi:hypothetical protein